MLSYEEIVNNWLPRYTGMEIDQFGDYILLTNFSSYVEKFAQQFDVEIYGKGRPMQAATNNNGLSIINFGIGSPNAATVMDLLSARNPKGVLFLGKCGGLKKPLKLAILSCLSVQFVAKVQATITFHQKFQHSPLLDYINLCRKLLPNSAMNTVAVLYTPPTDVSGSMMISSANAYEFCERWR